MPPLLSVPAHYARARRCERGAGSSSTVRGTSRSLRRAAGGMGKGRSFQANGAWLPSSGSSSPARAPSTGARRRSYTSSESPQTGSTAAATPTRAARRNVTAAPQSWATSRLGTANQRTTEKAMSIGSWSANGGGGASEGSTGQAEARASEDEKGREGEDEQRDCLTPQRMSSQTAVATLSTSELAAPHRRHAFVSWWSHWRRSAERGRRRTDGGVASALGARSLEAGHARGGGRTGEQAEEDALLERRLEEPDAGRRDEGRVRGDLDACVPSS